MAWTDPRTWTDTEFVDDDIMNSAIRDNFRAVGPHTMLMKTANQVVNNSSTLVNDTHLVLPVAANEVWKFELSLIITSNATADFKMGWSVPSGTTMRWAPLRFGSSSDWMLDSSGAAGQTALITESGTHGFNTPTTEFGLAVRGFIFVSTTAGNVNFQWAQNFATAVNTTVGRGSCMEARRGIG